MGWTQKRGILNISMVGFKKSGRWHMTEEEYVVFIQPYEDALKNIRVRVEVLNDDYRRK